MTDDLASRGPFMTRLLLLLALASAFGVELSLAGLQEPPVRAAGPVIVGYEFAHADGPPPGEAAANELTHVNYAFVELRNGRLVEDAADAANLQALTALRGSNPRLRVLASVGGWLGSKGFSGMALRPATRRVFVESAVDFVRRHDLDGLDVDWEYPGQRGNGNPHRPEDRASFSALLAELRAAFDAAGSGRPLLLTIAAGASDEYLALVDMAAVQASVDLVNLMTYDFAVPEAGDKAGHHANLRPHPSDPQKQSAEGSVREFLAAGVPPSKLVLGVPFYGRAWRGVGNRALYTRGKPLRLDVGSYPAILALIGRGGWSREWDEAAQAPYLWNARRHAFVSYEDPDSLRVKCRFVREQGLAGVMFWEYHADPTGVLLDTLARELRPVSR